MCILYYTSICVKYFLSLSLSLSLSLCVSVSLCLCLSLSVSLSVSSFSGPSYALADDAVVGEDDEVMSVDEEEGEEDETVVIPDSGEAKVGNTKSLFLLLPYSLALSHLF